MDFSVIKQLDAEGAFKHQKDAYRTTFAPTTYKKVSAEAPILTQTIRINFYPNSANIYEPQHDDVGNAIANTLYDPTVEATLEKVARLAGQYERADDRRGRPHRLLDEGQGDALRGRAAALARTAPPR